MVFLRKTMLKVPFFKDSGCCPKILDYTLVSLQCSLMLSLDCSLLEIRDPKTGYDLEVSTILPLKVKELVVAVSLQISLFLVFCCCSLFTSLQILS